MRQRIREYVSIFFNDTATTEIYTLSLHDALPISRARTTLRDQAPAAAAGGPSPPRRTGRATARAGRGSCPCRASSSRDRKSTRLNSSHANISYAVFCLQKKKNAPLTLFPNRPSYH